MKNLKLLTLVLAMMVFVLAACNSGNESTNDSNTSSEQSKGASVDGYPMTISPTIATTESEEAGTVAFKDVTLEKVPERIVVFDYGFLDTLDAIGVEGIVGIPKDTTLPAYLSKYASDDYANIGTLKAPLLEDIAALEPDVIFISSRQATFYEQLKEITPNVIFVGTNQNDYWGTFLKSTEIAGKIFGKEDEVKEHVAKIDTALEEVKGLASEFDTTLVTMYNEGKLSGFATNSRFGYIYDIYGFVPVTEDIEASSHGSNFGFEAILDFDPQVLFVIDRTAATGATSNIASDMENDIIKQTTAYKNNRIVYLDGPLWYLSGGGVQSELAKIQEILNELK
ncbi:siderophore ABC transporter substrate-binding protein [Ureibacillus manganicus]|uniref:Ferrichrome ABC transporter substrate-binding protein n=1 Tax=Ureibacillus manganicus DSM 26584 TaxID=1384049 RepID=A0A0A3I591_9BACL|nr:ABC transporter substrate-binding protein [Ureibacillus manganicus]KGR77833.1 ferrichrome ABC transporter substrate-binding protein [Ureibacillus manganicus DSM 26584]